jgi:glyoxylase-like metal-dependent hydrolase (beta-lactamase superfamily II)
MQGFIVLLFLGAVFAPPSLQIEITMERLSDDIIVFTESYWDGHMVAIDSGDGLVVVDTLLSPLLAAEARKTIEKEFPGRAFRYVVYTDCHWDHNAGNQVFKEAIIIGHANSVEKIRLDGAAMAQGYRENCDKLSAQLKGLDPDSEEAEALKNDYERSRQLAEGFESYVYTPPQIALEGRARIKIGRKTVVIHYPGPAHTDSDLAVFIPEDGLLVTGDLVLNHGAVLIDTKRGGDALNHIAALDQIINHADQISVIVPGHGPVGNMECVVEYRKQMQEILEAVRAARERGLTLEQAQAEIKMEKYSDYQFYSERIVSLCVAAFWNSLDKEAQRLN